MNDQGNQKQQDSAGSAPLYGLLAEYKTPDALIRAARLVRDSGFKRWDTFTPFPVHGIDPAMGIKPTILPWIVFCAGVTGCLTGIALQWWTNAVDYAWVVSGKPFWSVPANIPVVFEMTVLFSALSALGGMLVLNQLPHPSHPLDLKRRFSRVTDDRFFLLIEAKDPRYDDDSARKLLSETEATVVDELHDEAHAQDRLPRGLVYAMLILAVAAVVPFTFIAKARASKTRDTPIHIVPDMDFQPKVKPQDQYAFFADQRGMREPVSGTIAVGELQADEHLYQGRVENDWAKTFPSALPITESVAKRGEERFGVYCAPCHGFNGKGEGMVAQRAASLEQGTWVPPTNMIQTYILEQPVGQVFNTITHGIRNMPAYGPQIPVEDRWAIVLYVRALQRSQMAKPDDVSDSQRGLLQQ